MRKPQSAGRVTGRGATSGAADTGRAAASPKTTPSHKSGASQKTGASQKGAASQRSAISQKSSGGHRAGQRSNAGPPSVVNQPLAPVPESIIVGRWIAERACRLWRLGGAVRDVRQVVTELLANAVQHAGTRIVLTVSYREPWLMIAVRDGCPVLPRQVPGRQNTSGRGLLLVEAFAHAWGAARAGTGKVVWATIAAQPASDAPAASRPGLPLACRMGIPFAGRLDPSVPPVGHPKTVSARSFRLAG